MADERLLTCDYFAADVVSIARDLIGRRLVVHDAERTIAGIIIETEAYGDADDPASHAAFRPGGRAAAMSGAPGTVYVYSAYGMHPCFNIVTGPIGTASAVLIRGVWLDGEHIVTSGPGRLTRAMGISPDDHCGMVCGTRFGITVTRHALSIRATTRIGISRGVDLPWRFVGSGIESSNQ